MLSKKYFRTINTNCLNWHKNGCFVFSFIIIYFICNVSNFVCAAAPTRPATYTSNTTIRSADVTNNEVTLYNYLQAGVDSFADGSIFNADIASAAAIAYSKLSLGNSIMNSDINTAAAIAYSKLSLSSSIVSGDIVDGTIVNADINSSAAIAGSKLAEITEDDKVDFTSLNVASEAQGDIMYRNATEWTRLGAGTSGQVLKTGGAAANPSWVGSMFLAGSSSPSAASETGDISISVDKNYLVVFDLKVNTNSAVVAVRVNNISSGTYSDTAANGVTEVTIASVSADGNIVGSFLIKSFGDDTTALITGTSTRCDNVGQTIVTADFGGTSNDSVAVSSVELVVESGTGTLTGNVYVYELSG